MAQFGGASLVALAAGGCSCARPRTGPSHCAHVWSGGWRPRVVGTESQGQGLRRRLRGERHSLRGGGPRCLLPDAACGRLCPGFPVASSPHGSRPVRWYQVGPLLLWSSLVRLDTTGPVSLATPADATGNPGQPRVWCGHGPLGRVHLRVVTWRARDAGILPTGGVVPDPSSLSAVLAQPARTGGVRPNATRPQQRAIRLDTARPGWFPPGDDSDEGSGTRRPTHKPPPTRGVGDPSESRVPPPEAPALDFQAPTTRGRDPPT
ncbi:hypothetical protein ABH920_009146 [Catenulispora sp. EB89]